jgi:molecular chaperone DnaK (HSP70)
LRAIAEAKVPKEKIHEIILVGGPTRMPMVREHLGRLFGRPPLHTVDPMQAVALGAAIQASLLDASGSSEEMIVTDVCPFTLGVSALGEHEGELRPGVFEPIILRNTTLPSKQTKVFVTCHRKQDTVVIEVFQGDDPLVENNVFLDRYYIGGIPANTGKPEPIEITFMYDLDGILHVSALVVHTGKSAGIRIDPAKMKAVGFGLAKARAKVDVLWESSRSAATLLELVAVVERRLEEFHGDARICVESALEAARETLRSKNPKAMERFIRELSVLANQGKESDQRGI